MPVAVTVPCPRCGLKVVGPERHATADDCLRHLAPRYKLVQAAYNHLQDRFHKLEDRLERAAAARRQQKRDVEHRLAALEAALIVTGKDKCNAEFHQAA